MLLVWSWAGQAAAEESWNCNYAPVDTPTYNQTATYTISGNVLWGGVNDYTGKRDQFEIIEDGSNGLIAIKHFTRPQMPKPDTQALIVVIISKTTGLFKFHGYLVQSGSEDIWQGHCTPAVSQ